MYCKLLIIQGKSWKHSVQLKKNVIKNYKNGVFQKGICKKLVNNSTVINILKKLEMSRSKYQRGERSEAPTWYERSQIQIKPSQGLQHKSKSTEHRTER